MGSNRVADLTVDELRTLIREEMEALVREAVRDALAEITEEDADPDARLGFRPAIADRLQRYLKEHPQGRSLDDVINELGLDD
jgi:hypothetical protein